MSVNVKPNWWWGQLQAYIFIAGSQEAGCPELEFKTLHLILETQEIKLIVSASELDLSSNGSGKNLGCIVFLQVTQKYTKFSRNTYPQDICLHINIHII